MFFFFGLRARRRRPGESMTSFSPPAAAERILYFFAPARFRFSSFEAPVPRSWPATSRKESLYGVTDVSSVGKLAAPSVNRFRRRCEAPFIRGPNADVTILYNRAQLLASDVQKARGFRDEKSRVGLVPERIENALVIQTWPSASECRGGACYLRVADRRHSTPLLAGRSVYRPT